MQRTLERELKVPETAIGEAVGCSHTEKQAQAARVFEVGGDRGREASSNFIKGVLVVALLLSGQRGLGRPQKGGRRKHFVRVWISLSIWGLRGPSLKLILGAARRVKLRSWVLLFRDCLQCLGRGVLPRGVSSL